MPFHRPFIKRSKRNIILLSCVLLVGIAPASATSTNEQGSLAASSTHEEKLTMFPAYPRVNAPVASAFKRESKYVTTRDGTRIAVDIVFPLREDGTIRTALPTILEITGYGRAWVDPVSGALQRCSACEMFFWRYGYAVAVMDGRGTGASFGLSVDGPYTREGGRDAADVIAWLANQPWSNGAVGLVGQSYSGRMQYHAASEMPPALKAIMPSKAAFDAFDGHAVKGGIVRSAALQWTGAAATGTENSKEPLPAPVDGPEGPRLRDEARATNARAAAKPGPFVEALIRSVPDGFGRDEVRWGTELPEHGFLSHHLLLPLLKKAAVPTLIWAGWSDAYIIDDLRWMSNSTGFHNIVIGNWAHMPWSPGESADRRDIEGWKIYQSEALRWFDYWLLGIDTGIKSDPKVRYTLAQSDEEWLWRTAPNLDFMRGVGKDSLILENDRLVDKATAPKERMLKVDASATMGRGRLWDALDQGGRHKDHGWLSLYPDLSANDLKGLMFTSAPIVDDMNLVGAPIVELIVSANQPDAMISVSLTEVTSDGYSRYMSDGMSLISFRQLGNPPYDTLNWPWQTGRMSDRRLIIPNGLPVKLVLTLDPISRRLARGSRIRLTVHGADKDNVADSSVPKSDGTVIRIFTGGNEPSRLILPKR